MKNSIKLFLKLSLILITALIAVTGFWIGFRLLSSPYLYALNFNINISVIPFVNSYPTLGFLFLFFIGFPQFIAWFLLLANNNYAAIIAAFFGGVLLILCVIQLISIGWVFYFAFYLAVSLIEIVLGIIYFIFLKKKVYISNNQES